MSLYDQEYARKYIEKTLASPYNIYKNRTIAETLAQANVGQVWDLGGNVSGLMRLEGSLRFQLEKVGLSYGAIDLVPAYFDPDFARALGQLESDIYPEVLGAVGDLRYLPLATESVEAAVCADVIEHIDRPEQAMSELHRILKPGGRAIVVVPSLYKLDAIKLPHILEKRFSSHENRLTIAEWIALFESVGFVVDGAASRPLGIASGLLYLSWLNPDYVPSKRDANSPEEFSLAARSFQKVKTVVSKVDDKIDELLLNSPATFLKCQEAFKAGDIVKALELVQALHDRVTVASNPDLDAFVSNFDVGKVSLAGLDQLTAMISASNNAVDDQAFLGNSALVTLIK